MMALFHKLVAILQKLLALTHQLVAILHKMMALLGDLAVASYKLAASQRAALQRTADLHLSGRFVVAARSLGWLSLGLVPHHQST